MDWIAPLIALTCMEVVLGIDNIIFIAILASRLPESQQGKARTLGLIAALVTRVLLLLTISWIMQATAPLFYLTDYGFPESWLPEQTIAIPHDADAASDVVEPALEAPGELGDDTDAAPATRGHGEPHESRYDAMNGVSVRDLILLLGGAFLIIKSTREMHHKLEGDDGGEEGDEKEVSFGGVIFQIMLLDIVFSLDSVITAVGMADQLWVMITAVVIAVGFMLVAAGPVSRFVESRPTVKMLALSFLVLIGFTLAMEGLGFHIPKGYVYFAMAFSFGVEMLNLKLRIKPDLKAKGRRTPAGTVDATAG